MKKSRVWGKYNLRYTERFAFKGKVIHGILEQILFFKLKTCFLTGELRGDLQKSFSSLYLSPTQSGVAIGCSPFSPVELLAQDSWSSNLVPHPTPQAQHPKQSPALSTPKSSSIQRFLPSASPLFVVSHHLQAWLPYVCLLHSWLRFFLIGKAKK